MRASRLPGDLSVNATTRALETLRQRGIPIIDLTVSNPTTAGFDYPADLLASLASAAALVYDPRPFGTPSAREALAGEFARRGLAVPADRVVLTASTSEAYSWLFKLLCDPGDNVLVPQPSYPLFEHLTVLESVIAQPYRLEYHGAWRIDMDSVQDACNGRTRAILVVSPNNPTGSFLHRDDLAALEDVCLKHDLVLIGDEVFADYPIGADGGQASVLEATEMVAFSLGGLSKSVGLPQVKLGWIAFGGRSVQAGHMLSACELIADTYLSVSTPVQVALPDLLARGAAVREQIRQRVTRNYEALQRAAAAVPSVSVLNVEGGWSAVLRVPAYRTEEALVLELLTEDRVLVHPGFFFDFEHEAYLVVSLLGRPAEFDRGIERVLARAARPGAPS